MIKARFIYTMIQECHRDHFKSSKAFKKDRKEILGWIQLIFIFSFFWFCIKHEKVKIWTQRILTKSNWSYWHRNIFSEISVHLTSLLPCRWLTLVNNVTINKLYLSSHFWLWQLFRPLFHKSSQYKNWYFCFRYIFFFISKGECILK